MRSINPHNDQIIREYQADGAAELEEKLKAAHDTKHLWSRVGVKERIAFLKNLATLLENNTEEYATLISMEMGKALSESIAEVQKCARVCHYYVEHAVNYLEDRIVETEASKSYISYQPIGIVLGIMPWNFPFWQVFRFLAPTLMAGNIILVKHASNVQGCANLIQDLVNQAEFPANCYTNLQIKSDKVSEVIADSRINAITLTGSTEAGIAVAEQAGRLLKKTVLELGGSDPYIVLADADIEAAVDGCLTSRLLNNGQSCIAAKRFIIETPVYERFLNQLKSRTAAFVVGNPMDKLTQLGPMASKILREELHQQVEKAVEEGAQLITGGEIPEGPGSYYPVTILAGIRSGMTIYNEELFGPVFSLIQVDSVQEAVAVANSTDFGLGAAIYSQNIQRAEQIARTELLAGTCAVNDFVRSDPRLPFGGIKKSGYGRELAQHGMYEFTNIKSIILK